MSSPSVAANRPSERLLSLLARQKYLVDQIASLASRQREIVRDGNAEAMLDVLGKRQELIDRVMEAQSEIVSINTEIGGGALNSDDRLRASRLMQEIEGRLSEIMKRDEDDCKEISALRDRTRGEIATFGQAQKARQAYAPAPRAAGSATPRFSDEKG